MGKVKKFQCAAEVPYLDRVIAILPGDPFPGKVQDRIGANSRIAASTARRSCKSPAIGVSRGRRSSIRSVFDLGRSRAAVFTPTLTNRRATTEPTKPAAPVTKQRKVSSSRHARVERCQVSARRIPEPWQTTSDRHRNILQNSLLCQQSMSPTPLAIELLGLRGLAPAKVERRHCMEVSDRDKAVKRGRIHRPAIVLGSRKPRPFQLEGCPVRT